MCKPSLVLLSLLLLFLAPGLHSQANDPGTFRVTLRLGEQQRGFSLEGKSLALVRNTPHKGIPAFTILKVEGSGSVSWSVPAAACDGSDVRWFLVEGLQRADQVASFYEHPEKWTWATWAARVQPGARSTFTDVIEKGSPLLAHGRIQTADGHALPQLFPTMSYLSPVTTQAGGGWGGWGIGIDEVSGRFWIQSGRKYSGVKLGLSLSPMMLEGNGYVQIKNHPLDREGSTTIVLRPEARLVGKILGVDKDHWYSLRVELRQGNNVSYERGLGMDPKLDVASMPTGTYDLRITTKLPTEILFERKGLQLEEGKVLELDGPVDLRKQFQLVRIEVRDEKGQPLAAYVERYQKGKGRSWSTSRVPMAEKGEWDCLVRPSGGKFRIWMDGQGQRFLNGVKSDQVVTLYRPRELRLEFRGLPEDKTLLDNLYVQALPAEGFEDWTWKILKPRPMSKRMRAMLKARGSRLGKVRPSFCFAPIGEDGTAQVILTKPGKWKLRILYLETFRQMEVSLTHPVEVEVTRQRQAQTLTLDPAAVKAAHDKMYKRRFRRR